MKKLLSAAIVAAFLFSGFSLPSHAATKNGWVSSKGHWYFYNQSGKVLKGWLKSGKQWYYMDNTGAMKTGWVSDHGKWYYMDNTGSMKTGWVLDHGKWYYMDNTGAMKTGWVSDHGKWYYMDNTGSMKTGWVLDHGKWYYMDNAGAMKTGWIQDKGQWYFLTNSGSWDKNAKHDATPVSENVQYFPVAGSKNTAAGIYKAVPNGTLSLVQKEDMDALDWGQGTVMEFTYIPPKTPFKLDDMNMYAVVKGVSTNFADDYDNVYEPISSVQSVGTDLYYTKFYFASMYAGSKMGGGRADILQIYKRDKFGKTVKVTNDTVSSKVGTPFYVSGSNIYYAKVENKALNNFTLVKMDLNTSKKTTIATGIDDFWVDQDTMYYFTEDTSGSANATTIHTMNMNGEKTADLVIGHALYGESGVDGGNYAISQNGIIEWDYPQGVEKDYFFDYKTKAEVNLPIDVMSQKYNDSSIWVQDVDVKHNRMIVQITDNQTNATTLGLYNLKGSLIKSFGQNYDIVSTDAVKGEIQYIEANTLKTISF